MALAPEEVEIGMRVKVYGPIHRFFEGGESRLTGDGYEVEVTDVLDARTYTPNPDAPEIVEEPYPIGIGNRHTMYFGWFRSTSLVSDEKAAVVSKMIESIINKCNNRYVKHAFHCFKSKGWEPFEREVGYFFYVCFKERFWLVEDNGISQKLWDTYLLSNFRPPTVLRKLIDDSRAKTELLKKKIERESKNKAVEEQTKKNDDDGADEEKQKLKAEVEQLKAELERIKEELSVSRPRDDAGDEANPPQKKQARIDSFETPEIMTSD